MSVVASYVAIIAKLLLTAWLIGLALVILNAWLRR